ncbi:hypothetical protein PIB30_053091, partial [Stylosanthes scabra]|nr:hypothetical protein [Stylosanthes scabra]
NVNGRNTNYNAVKKKSLAHDPRLPTCVDSQLHDIHSYILEIGGATTRATMIANSGLPGERCGRKTTLHSTHSYHSLTRSHERLDRRNKFGSTQL